MPSGYECLDTASPRSLLFYIVANVGLGGSSRPLAVAYRQGNDFHKSFLPRVENLVNDILSAIKIFSKPEDRSALEAERWRATEWYNQQLQDDADGGEGQRYATLPDSLQPPWSGYKMKNWRPALQPEMSPRKDASPRMEFSLASDYLVKALLCSNSNTREGDVQLQPLSLPFYGNCLEYGMVVIDISNLSRITYGIACFPVCYMAYVEYHSYTGGWDPVEDDPPKKEPDVVLVNERPRLLSSILCYVRKNFPFLEDDAKVRELEESYSLVDDAGMLDYIWPLSDDVSQECLEPSQEELPKIARQRCSIM
ncbi:unnamed protein product [Periconia digitata]|uniref:Uncharacterized protein n=1 Tax=Periconia digitata TaxID=1303443 RepID=A0A9W4UUN6_9PLEO|nr:unnamed protein product [Periconia digitata]